MDTPNTYNELLEVATREAWPWERFIAEVAKLPAAEQRRPGPSMLSMLKRAVNDPDLRRLRDAVKRELETRDRDDV